MKTLEELKAFCEGYTQGLVNDRAFYGTPLSGCDDWVIWGGYDINFAGSAYSQHADDNELRCDAYKAGWVDNIGEPIHSFTIKGEANEIK